MRRVMPCLSMLLSCLLATAAQAADAPPRPALLAALDGQWIMTGDVMGKPVTYTMQAAPTLQGSFSELHMTDVQVPSQYEARVFIGADTDGGVIVHWLDSFGGAYSIPHGTGRIEGERLQFFIPYRSGEFRDTLTRQPENGRWRLLIEAKKPDGSWQHFAAYTIARRAD
jgi:hypothetical protein